MADDLKEELRLIRCYANGDARCTCNIGQDAAARIERLEAALLAADECVNAMNFTVAIAHQLDSGDGSEIVLLDEILSTQNMALTAYIKARYRKARGSET